MRNTLLLGLHNSRSPGAAVGDQQQMRDGPPPLQFFHKLRGPSVPADQQQQRGVVFQRASSAFNSESGDQAEMGDEWRGQASMGSVEGGESEKDIRPVNKNTHSEYLKNERRSRLMSFAEESVGSCPYDESPKFNVEEKLQQRVQAQDFIGNQRYTQSNVVNNRYQNHVEQDTSIGQITNSNISLDQQHKNKTNTSGLSGMIINSDKIDQMEQMESYEDLTLKHVRSDPKDKSVYSEIECQQQQERRATEPQKQVVQECDNNFGNLQQDHNDRIIDSDEFGLDITNPDQQFQPNPDQQQIQPLKIKSEQQDIFQNEENVTPEDIKEGQRNVLSMQCKQAPQNSSITLPYSSPQRQSQRQLIMKEENIDEEETTIRTRKKAYIMGEEFNSFNVNEGTPINKQSFSMNSQKEYADDQLEARDQEAQKQFDQKLPKNYSSMMHREPDSIGQSIDHININELNVQSPKGMNKHNVIRTYRKGPNGARNDFPNQRMVSPTHGPTPTSARNKQLVRTNHVVSLNALEIQQQEQKEVKKYKISGQPSQFYEQKRSPKLRKQHILPLQERVNFQKTKLIVENQQRSPKNPDSPQHHRSRNLGDRHARKEKRLSLQSTNGIINQKLKNNDQSVDHNPFDNKSNRMYNRQISDHGNQGPQFMNKSSPIMKSMELTSAQNKNMQNMDINSSNGSFVYPQQQSIGPGSLCSGSTPPPADADVSSPRLEDRPKRSKAPSTQSNSSYKKFKKFMYNKTKEVQAKHQSKICINLKEKQFFHHAKDRDTRTQLLHKKYVNKKNFTTQEVENLNYCFKFDWNGITWFSYRDEIERPIGSKDLNQKKGLDSDYGWGCMIRTGQMILFQALIRHCMNDMSYVDIFQKKPQKYYDLLLLFMDNSPVDDTENKICPFGIHSISQEAKDNHRHEPGEWYDPLMISIVLRDICNTKSPINQFKIHVCREGNIFLDEIEKLLDQGNSVFVLITIKLAMGKSHIPSKYMKQVKQMFQLSQNVGMMGGKSHMALYFVGDEDIQKSDSALFYLDPHYLQNAVPSSEFEKSLTRNQSNRRFQLQPQYLETYHTNQLRTLDPNNMQTSLAPGFYIRDHESFKKWVKQLKEMKLYFADKFIFSLFDEKPQFMKDSDSEESPSKLNKDEDKKLQTSPKLKESAQRDDFRDEINKRFENLNNQDQDNNDEVIFQQYQQQKMMNYQTMAKHLSSIKIKQTQDAPNRFNSCEQFKKNDQQKQIESQTEIQSNFSKTMESNLSKTLEPTIITDYQETPCSSQQYGKNSSIYSKSNTNDEINSPDLSRDSKENEDIDIDAELIDVCGAQVVDVNQSNNQSLKLQKPLQKTMTAIIPDEQTKNDRNLDVGNKIFMSQNSPERQLSSKGQGRRTLPKVNSTQQLKFKDSDSGAQQRKQTEKRISQQAIGPRTMMFQNLSKSSKNKPSQKSGHRADQGSINNVGPQQFRGGVFRIQNKLPNFVPQSQQVMPKSRNQTNGTHFQSKSEVTIQSSQISGSLNSNQSPNDRRQTQQGKPYQQSNKLHENQQLNMMPQSKTFPNIMVGSVEGKKIESKGKLLQKNKQNIPDQENEDDSFQIINAEQYQTPNLKKDKSLDPNIDYSSRQKQNQKEENKDQQSDGNTMNSVGQKIKQAKKLFSQFSSKRKQQRSITRPDNGSNNKKEKK